MELSTAGSFVAGLKKLLFEMVLAGCRPILEPFVVDFFDLGACNKSKGRRPTGGFPLFFDDDSLVEWEWPGGVGVPSVYEDRSVPTGVFLLFLLDDDPLEGAIELLELSTAGSFVAGPKKLLLDMVVADCRPILEPFVIGLFASGACNRSEGRRVPTRVFPLFFDDDSLEGEWPGGVGVPSVYEGRRVPTSVFPLFMDDDLLEEE